MEEENISISQCLSMKETINTGSSQERGLYLTQMELCPIKGNFTKDYRMDKEQLLWECSLSRLGS